MDNQFRKRCSPPLLLVAAVLVTVAIVAITVGFFAQEIDGRICRKSELLSESGVHIGRSPFPPVAIEFATLDGAKEVLESIDVERCRTRAKELYAAAYPGTPYFSSGTFTAGRTDRTVFLRFDFDRWGRYRFDSRAFQYVFDPEAPIASRRNGAIERCYLMAAHEQLNQRQVNASHSNHREPQ